MPAAERKSRRSSLICLLACGGAVWTNGCGSGDFAAADDVSTAQGAVIYGNDDRREYYDAEVEAFAHLFEAHAVALVDAHWIAPLLDRRMDRLPKWRELDGLCADEPFADQPAVAFCSGVLAGPGLVLTAEHCIRATPIERMRVVFGYYYVAPDQLALGDQDVHEVATVLTKSSDSADIQQLDFAWLRLAANPRPPHAPAPLIDTSSPLRSGDTIVTVSAGGGAPLKIDANGKLRQARTGSNDVFVADSDTFRGSSGAGAFNRDGALVGTFMSGRTDFQLSDRGCRTAMRHDADQAEEQFTSVHRAVEGLCRVEPTLSTCGQDGLGRRAPPSTNRAQSCAAAPLSDSKNVGWPWFVLPMVFIGRVRTKRPGRGDRAAAPAGTFTARAALAVAAVVMTHSHQS